MESKVFDQFALAANLGSAYSRIKLSLGTRRRSRFPMARRFENCFDEARESLVDGEKTRLGVYRPMGYSC